MKHRNCTVCCHSKLWNDDSHNVCFRCRTREHDSDACDLCKTMGPYSASKWQDFVNPPNTKPSKYVSMKDFEVFQTKIESMFKSNADMIQQWVMQKPTEWGQASTSVPRAEERNEVRSHGRQPRAGVEPDFEVLNVDEDDLDESATGVSSWNFKRSRL